MLHINNEFALGDIVKMKSEGDLAGMVVGVSLFINGSVLYSVSWNPEVQSNHFVQELSLVEAVESM